MSLGANKQALMGAAGSGGAADDFYSHQIANSCRFNGAGRLLRTNGSAPTLATKYTFSTWIKRSKLSSHQIIFGAETNNVNYDYFNFRSDNLLEQTSQRTASYVTRDLSVYRDTSAYYHLVFQWDTTLASATDRLKVYVNGVRLSWDQTQYSGAIPQDTALKLNENGASLSVGYTVSYTSYLNGYMAQTAGIDGSIVAIGDLGETKNGVWIAKDLSGLTFGNNGFLLDYASSSDMGNDVSGNNNDFTPTSIAAHDQMLDSPTFNSDSNANFPTINVLDPTIPLAAISEGNLKITEVANNRGGKANFGIPSSGKWYWEVYANNNIAQENWAGITGPTTDSSGDGRGGSGNSTTYGINFSQYGGGGVMSIRKFIAGTESGVSGSLGTTTYGVLGITVNKDDNEVKFYHNNTLYITNSIPAGQEFFPAGGLGGGTNSTTFQVWNYGQDGTFAGNATAQGNSDANGYGNFTYTPPTGFLALCSGNLPTADAVDPAQTDDDYPQKLFGILKYTGNGSQRTISTAFQFDWLWSRSSVQGQNWYNFDTNRGIFGSNNYYLKIDADDAEADLPQDNYISQTASGSDAGGYVLSNGSWFNSGSHTQINWFWRANGGSTSSDASGDITSVGQKDPSGCFSIVTYTGSGTQAQTIAHHLDQAPIAFIAKKRNGANNWMFTAGTSYMNDRYAYLDSLGAAQGGLYGGGRSFSANAGSSLMALEAAGEMNGSGSTYVGYFFSNCEGYIKIGEYDGNGTTGDGTFVYTGFRPAMVITKMLDGGAEWSVYDDVRDTYNVSEHLLQLDLSDAERTDLDEIDILSNGFKCQSNGGRTNQSSKKYIFLAFAKNPFKYSVAR